MIVDKIQEYIGDHSAPGVLFVIKGYAFTEFESCATSLGKTIEDKGSRFMEILQQPTKVMKNLFVFVRLSFRCSPKSTFSRTRTI